MTFSSPSNDFDASPPKERRGGGDKASMNDDGAFILHSDCSGGYVRLHTAVILPEMGYLGKVYHDK